MKKINIILLFALTLFFSCDLDRYPETTFTDNAYWVSESDLRAACNRLYWNETAWGFDFRADDMFSGQSKNSTSNGSRMPSARSDDWKRPYKAIGVANNIIAKVTDPANFSSVPQKVLNRYISEAYFFRAKQYYTLVSKYGAVPLLLTPVKDVDDPVLKMAKSDRETVVNQMYKDLDSAAKYLPTHSALPKNDWGRVTRSAALALKARIALYEGTRSKFHNDGRDYASHLRKAIGACDTIIAEGQHDLYSNYTDLFQYVGEGPDNKENIHVRIYGVNYENKIVTRAVPHEYCGITRKMVDMYLCADGLPWGKSTYTIPVENQTTYNEIFQNRDPRMTISLYQIGETAYKGNFSAGNNLGLTCFSSKKGFVAKDFEEKTSTLDLIEIRYAEILLILAEATYELNGSISDALLEETINKLRERAGFRDASNNVVKLTNAFVSANNLDMRTEIRRERTVELAFENLRYDDIMRWKTAETELPMDIVGAKYTNTSDFGGNAESDYANLDAKKQLILETGRVFNPLRDYLYPIPTTDIYLSDNAIEQNPEWSK